MGVRVDGAVSFCARMCALAIARAQHHEVRRCSFRPDTMWVFYYIQGEEGEDNRHPNAFEIPDKGGKICLSDVTSGFPLCNKGVFHFRFRVNAKRGYMWADLTDPGATVPLTNGKIITKVLRLGTYSSHS
jgi:hypothetical protein